MFWKSDKTFTVNARSANSSDTPMLLKASCREVHVDEDGNFSYTDNYFKVVPEQATINPKQIFNFKIQFPIPDENKSVLFAFTVIEPPKMMQTKNEIQIPMVMHRSWIGCASFIMKGDYDATPMLKQEGDKIVVDNAGQQFAIEGTLDFLKGGESIDRKHFYIEASAQRYFKISDGADSVVLHNPKMDRRQGLRIRTRLAK